MSGPSTAEQVNPDRDASVALVPAGARSDDERRHAHPANGNSPAASLVVLRATGDGAVLYRALARVLVRSELKTANDVTARDDQDSETQPRTP